MLQQYRRIASINDGLLQTSEAMTKGMLVVKKLNASTKEFELALPTEETDKPYGFITNQQTLDDHVTSYYDAIAKGERAIVWTKVPNEVWVTDQFTGTLEVGDLVGIDVANKGKVKKVTDNALLQVVEVFDAGTKADNACVALEWL